MNFGSETLDFSIFFPFQTTKAIIFNNKVKMNETHFSCTVYGLTRNNFTVAVLIYGHHMPIKLNKNKINTEVQNTRT